jgi:hypothetical protein
MVMQDTVPAGCCCGSLLGNYDLWQQREKAKRAYD